MNYNKKESCVVEIFEVTIFIFTAFYGAGDSVVKHVTPWPR
jgi:hypothetical protein